MLPLKNAYKKVSKVDQDFKNEITSKLQIFTIWDFLNKYNFIQYK